MIAQSKNWLVPGRVRDHKCFVDFVIFEDLPEELQDSAFNVGKLEINKWKQHEFNDNK